MASLVAIAIAMALMVVQPGRQMTAFAARTSPAAAAEAFWRAAMPGAPMPDAIVELLHHGESVNLIVYTTLNDTSISDGHY
ncbi:hypothetical protein OsJ_29774 [Oryza sativa Japonica Group]|uniref:Uncharacterized protein n=2 Tax=Oryza TaxID=4527 RepID=B9G473_ORYSJ|nr:hypothetical protein OsJ_29774 [Oryza sativa Japonica Group]